MNLLNWLCCREKPKQQNKQAPIVAVKHFSSKCISDQLFSSEPFDRADKYKGQERSGVPNGNGEMMYKNGDYYRGEWVNGQKEGRGLQIYNQKGYKYEGEWKGNLPNGQGKIIFEDGSYYVGEFKDNIRNGKGQYYDFQNKRYMDQIFENGVLLKQKIKEAAASRDQEFPTLVLDKQRFNSEDLLNFQKQNPEIKQLEVTFLVKYYDICKIMNLPFIKKHIKEWRDREIREFLEAINLSKYRECFYRNKILGKSLITLSENQMKDDLNMKLGDRRRLANYCKYLTEIYNEEKKKKENRKACSIRRIHPEKKKTELVLSDGLSKSNHFRTAYIDEGNIIQQQNQFDESNQAIFQQTNSGQIKESQRSILTNDFKNYETKEWIQYYSNQIHCQHEDNAYKFQENQHIPKSQKSSSTQNKNSLSGSVVKNISIRKQSKQQKDEEAFISSIPHKIKISQSMIPIPDHEREKLKQQKSSKNQDEEKKKLQKGSSSSSSSSTSSCEEVPDLVRKKTAGTRLNKEGGLEIRQLYEFLKERGNLQFIIKQREIQLLELIGEGGYGKVYKGKYMSCPVAVKDYIKTRKHQNQQDFLKELEILSGLKHPHIVLYMGICITTDKYQLVTEYLENGSLFDQIHKKNKQFTKDEILNIVDELVKGMVYLHNMKKILHRDLKSSNVLLDEDWKVKLCDFGLSGHKKKSKKKSQGRVGTYQWMAPEVMRKEEMDFFSDVYSFGVLLWQLLSNKIPYDGYTEHQIIGVVGYDDNYKLKFETEGSMWKDEDFIVQLMNECLNRVPDQRPTFIQIQSKLNDYFELFEEQRPKR